ncbi:pyroglutamyl peptidase type I [Coccidioides immitis RS]|uniref:Pyroglutamyl peptidase type I n=3 Tax=Coccidioides immitis TaxID=5501 RepID=A0A0E1RYC6_COCIM|nr:pyroglutamyl peptidase type I [Coccidioides immitis RS]EAS35791.1 pyroglutamyl peptidase type I [Coccidioides immitis RS]KMP01077.1 hypothetical protein CIRG_01217 [Coccidioides immitis RMSCC 2394]KMU83584.1 hypothetical protein CIHG_01367 [Coccidioides immitis H538.4]
MGDFGPEVPSEGTLPGPKTTDPAVVKDEVHVLITGFGPFKTNPLNPSFLISSTLPATIPTTPSSSRTVRIHTHPCPIRVSYSTVRVTIPTIIDSFKRTHNGQAPDLIIHIGMASTRHYYSVETQAHRDGYRVTDIDGQLGYDDGEAFWKWEGLPETLQPGPPRLDVSSAGSARPVTASSDLKRQVHIHPSSPDAEFLETWRSYLPPKTDIRLSEDAGRYLCEFIYYTSLAHAYKDGRSGNVVFLHVPGWTDQGSIEKGKAVVIGLIRALVACWIEEGAKANG